MLYRMASVAENWCLGREGVMIYCNLGIMTGDDKSFTLRTFYTMLKLMTDSDSVLNIFFSTKYLYNCLMITMRFFSEQLAVY